VRHNTGVSKGSKFNACDEQAKGHLGEMCRHFLNQYLKGRNYLRLNLCSCV
jgi:hypothetical protein